MADAPEHRRSGYKPTAVIWVVVILLLLAFATWSLLRRQEKPTMTNPNQTSSLAPLVLRT